jgi:hypothetical protein
MTSRFGLVVSLLCATSGAATDRGDNKSSDDHVVFRPPFTLRVPVDGERYYEEKKVRTPYIYQGEVGLFIGDHFGLKIDVQKGTVRSIRYERDLSKADVTLEFKQGDPIDGKATSLLIMQNRTKYTFLMDARMTVPDRKDILPTSFDPVRGGIYHFESWPHAIVQLGLRNIRVQK